MMCKHVQSIERFGGPYRTREEVEDGDCESLLVVRSYE